MKKPNNDNVNANVKKTGRKRRAAGWMLFTLGVLLAAVWMASGWWSLWYQGDTGSIGVGRGTMNYNWQTWPDKNPQRGLGTRPYASESFAKRFCWWRGFAAYEEGGRGGIPFRSLGIMTISYSGEAFFSVWLDLWPIPLVLWTHAALLLRSGILARRRASRDMCIKCGYSLAGLGEEAACPECGNGTKIETKAI